DSAVEAEAGLDADGEQVERVGQLRTNQLTALSGPRADHEVWSEKAHPAERDTEEKPNPAHDCPKDHPDQEAADPDGSFHREDGAKLAVGGRALHRNLTVAGGRRCRLTEEVGRAGEEEDCKQDQKHGLTP